MKILRRQRVALTYLMLALTTIWQIGQPLRGVTVYWDINGTTAGASSGAQAAGIWDGTNTFFNTDATGGAGGTISAWSAGDILAFAAGTNSRNAYTVTVSGTQSIGGLNFEEGVVTLSGGTLQLAGNSDFNVAGTLTGTIQSVVDGAFNLTKTGAGTLALSGTNTYTGKTIINTGVLSISADANLGTAPGAVVADSLTFGGGTLQVTGTGNPTINSNRGITINAGVTGTVQVAAVANVVTYGGVITGAAGTTLAKTGPGTLSLQGNSTASMLGALNVGGGTLRLSGSGALAGVSSVTLGNRGVITLDNTTTNLADRLSGGVFTSNGGAVNFTHGGAAATNYTENIGAVTLGSGTLSVSTSQAAASQTSSLVLASLGRNAGGTAFFSGTGLGTDARNAVILAASPALTNSVLPYAVVSNGTLISFANYATSSGANQALRPLALASHDQTTQGTGWVATDNLRPTADQALSGNRPGFTLTLDNGIDITDSSTSTDRVLTLGNGTFAGILQTGGVSEIRANSSGDVTVDFTTSEGIVHVIGTLNMLRSGANNFSGSGGITKAGPGLLTVQVNGNTGTLRLNEGIYRATGSSTSAIGAAATPITFNGGTLELAHTANLSYVAAGPVQVNADALITIDRTASGAGLTHTLAGALTIGNQTLTVAKGSLITADSAYGLTFSNIAVGVTLTGSPTFLVDNNGTAAGTINLAAVNSSGGLHTIIKQGTGNLIMSGTTGFQNMINVEAGQIGWSNNTAATNITESNLIYGPGGIFKSGASTVNLTALNTYLGATTITAGALQAQDGVGLSSSSNLVLNGGVFQTNGTFTRSLGTGAGQVQWVAGGSGGFAANGGPLTVTLSGAPNPIQWDTPSFVSGAGALMFGSTSADDVVTFTHNIDLNHTGVALSRTFTVTDNTTSTADKAVLSGILSNSGAAGGITKTGNGILELNQPNTFTGDVAANGGYLQFSTVSNIGGPASNLGQGSAISVGAGVLSFIGSASQSTDRPMTLNGGSSGTITPGAASTLDASGTGGATITYNGAFTVGANSLNLSGTGMGILNAAVVQSGTTADLNKMGTGTWRIDVAPTLVDNMVVHEGTLILNAANSFTPDDIFIRNATLKLTANAAIAGADDLNISTETTGGGFLDLAGTTGHTTAEIYIGANPVNQPTGLVLAGSLIDSVGGGSITTTNLFVRNGTVSGLVNTTGTSTVAVGNVVSAYSGGSFTTSGTVSGPLMMNTGSSLLLYNGAVSGTVTFASGITLAKHSVNTVTVSGDNVVTGAGASTLAGGTLILDYGTNTGAKLSGAGLTMSGGILRLNGHASTAVIQSVGNLTLGSAADPGGATVQINTHGADTTLQVGTITRNIGSTLRFNPSSASAHLTTSTTVTPGSLLGGWATYQLGTGSTYFATVTGGEIVAAMSTAIDNVAAWTTGADVTDSSGFTGTAAANTSINSLRFDAAGGASTVTIGTGNTLTLGSGGILITSNVSAGAPSITGGRLAAGAGNEIIVTHDGAAPFTLGSSLFVNVGLTKAGSGLMILNNTANSSLGAVRVTGGTLRLMGGGAIGNMAPVTLDSQGSVLLDVVDSETIGALSGGDANNFKGMAIQIANGQELTVNQLAAGTFYGDISATSGSATFTKMGASTLTLTDSLLNLGPAGVINVSGGRLTLDINGNNNQLTQISSGTTVNISNGGSMLIDHDGITVGGITEGRIANNVAFNLNSGGSTTDSLYYRHDQDDDHIETIGAVTLGSGVSSIRVDADTDASNDAVLRATSVTRQNQATLVLRGDNIHKTAVPRSQFQNTAVLAAFGTGTGTSLPVMTWAIGPAAGGSAVADSFVTTAGTANAQWRPLNLTTEYAIVTDATTWGTAASTNNTRVTATVTGAASTKTIRSLLMETGAGVVNLTGDGAGNLTVDSGGFLFSGTGSSTITGFTGINVNATANEYVFHVMGSSATISSPLTTATARLTKSGPGTLFLAATNTGLGDVAINEGAVQITDLDNIGGNTGNLLLAGGTLRLDATTWSNDDISGRTITLLPGGGTLDTNGHNITFANAFATGSVGGLTKTGAGSLTLNGQGGYSGRTVVSGGSLVYGVANALSPTMRMTLGDATLDIGAFNTSLSEFNLAGGGTINGSAPLTVTGNAQLDGGVDRTLTVNNSGLTSFNGSLLTLVASGTTARTFTLGGSGNVTIAGQIANGTAAGSLTMAGTGNLTLSGINTYTGTTTIDNGTMTFTADQNLAGGLRFGTTNTTTTTGTLDLTNANATFGGTLVIQTNSTTPNNLIIGASKTLTIGGNVTIGSAAAALTDVVLHASGGGSLVVNNAASGAFFQVGGSTSGTAGTIAVADFSGLGNLTIALNTTNGVVRVNPVNSTNVPDRLSTLILPGVGTAATTITAATLAVGDSSQGNSASQVNQLKLGGGVNTFNINTVNIGTGGRDSGAISFNTASGSLVLNDVTGSGPVAFNMGTGSATTAAAGDNTFDVTGHNVVLNLGAVNIGTQTGRGGALTNVFSFNQGTLNMASLNLSSRNTAGGTTSTFNIGGGTVNSGAITMATTGAAAGLAVANLNITGGTVTLSGHISKGGGAGNDTANILLTGATTVLDMGGFNLGSGANPIDSVALESGTLKNLGEFNGGAPLVKTTAGTLNLDGTNTHTGGTDVQEGTVVVVGGAGNRLGSGGVSLGAGALSGVLQLGNAAGASNQTILSLSTSGTGTANAVVGGNAAFSTLTVNQSVNTTFNGALGGAGSNQNNLNLAKSGAGELVIGRAATLAGTVAVNGGKLFFDGYAGASITLTSLSLADGTEFSLRGTSPSSHSVYGFSGSGNVITVGGGVGGTLGFALDGAFNTRLNLGAGQTMAVNGTLTTAVYVNGAPNANQQYVLINAADDNAIFGSGTFNFSPVVFNGGSFTYALSQITSGAGEQWVLTPTAQAAAADVWWKGDLTGIATGVWSASLTSGTGFPTNWDTTQSGGVDALVPPDSGSIVHFSATGATNFATTLGANLTIQELIFHPGGTAVSIGSSGGTNTLTLGNTVDGSGLTNLAGAPNVSISANVALAQAQSWNITDTASTLTLSGSLSGVGPLSINNNGTSTGTLILSGASGLATYSGGTNLVAGKLILEGGADDRLPVTTALTMGNATLGATMHLGDAVNGASNNTIGTLNTGAALTNSIVGGGAAPSILTINQATNGTFNGVIGGAGTNENNVGIAKRGPGTLVLNGVNTYTGTTTVNQGILQLGSIAGITQGGALTVSANAGTTAAFDINGRPVTLTGGITFGGADNLATPQILDTAGGGLLTVGGNIVFDATNNPLGASIAPALNLGGAARTITVGDSSSAAVDLTIAENISNNPGANGFALTVDGAGTLNLNGNVLLGPGTTDGANSDFTKNGAGTLNITGSVTISDNFTVNTGVVNINAGGSVVFNSAGGSTTPDFVIDSTATPVVNLNTVNAIVGNSSTTIIYVRDGSTLNINADGAIGTSVEEIRLGDNDQGIGNLVMNSNSTVGILTLGNDSSGEIGNVTGTGTLTVTTLNLDNGMVSANLSGAGNIDKDNLNVTLSGNNSLTGTTTVREGTLNLDFTTHNGASSKIGTGNLVMGSTTNNDTLGVLNLTGNATASSLQTVANLSVAGGNSQISFTPNGGQDVTLRITGTMTRTAGTLNLVLPDANSRVEYTGSTVNTNGIVGGWMTLNDRDFVTISGGLLQAATYTTQNNASLWTTNGNITNSGGGFTGTVPANCNTINSLRFDAAAVSSITVTESLYLSSGAMLLTSTVGANASTISGGSLVSGSGAFIFHQNNTGLLTINSNLLGGAQITKSGTGTLVLTGSNVTGTVNIDQGILRVSGGNAISDNSAVNIRDVASTGLEIVAGAGNSETIGSLAGDGAAGQVIIGSGATLTLNQTASGTFGGIISGAGNLVKNGAGVLTVTGDASMSGLLTLNGGRITMSGTAGAINDVSGYVLNGAELLSSQDQSAAENRIRDTTATITLNNTGGTNGLWVQRSAADSTATENVGSIVLGAGHNVITVDPTTGTGTGNSTLADILSDGLVRGTSRGTLLVHGTNLGSASSGARRGFIRFEAAGQATVDGYEVGDVSNALTKIKIIPWMIGDTTTAGLGNSFVTNVDGTTGLRPLASGEYINNSTTISGALTDNIRYTASAGITTTPTAINSLVLDSGTAIALSGSASAMEVTTGAILAAGAGNHSISGISAITAGGGRDYNIFVTAAASTLTMNPALTSAVPLVKSGAGNLSLTNTGNAFTDLYLNQGFVAANDLDKLGTGTLNFQGGGLRLEAGFTDDLSTKAMNVGTGGGTLDVSLVTAGVTLTNGLDAMITGAGGPLNIFTRNSATGNTGVLTIQGSSSYTGTVIFRNSNINGAVTNGVVLNGATNAAINGNIEIGNVTNIDNTFDVVLSLGANEQIVDTASILFRAASGENAYFKLMGFTETVAGISGTSNEGVIENVESTETGVTTNGKLIVDSSDDYSYTGYMRNRGSGANAMRLEFEKRGSGTQTLVGTRVTYTGDTTITGGTLQLTDTTGFASNVINNATLLLNSSSTWNLGVAISGTGAVTKTGTGALTLSGANSYSGQTSIEQGTVVISSSANLGDGSATNTVRIANGAVLQSTGANVDLGVNRSITLAGAGGGIDVTGASTLTASGAINGDACHTLTKSGTGMLVLTNASNATSFAGGLTQVNAGILQVGSGGVGSTGTGLVSVASGAVLAGTGTVAGSLSIASGGVLHMGDVTLVGSATTTTTGIGTLNVTGDVNLAAGSTTLFTLDTPASSDFLNIGGNITLSGNIVVTGSITPTIGMTFDLIDWSGLGSDFTGFNVGLNGRTGADDNGFQFDLPDISMFAGLSWDISNFMTSGSISIAAIPEPSRALMLLFGMLVLFMRRRRD